MSKKRPAPSSDTDISDSSDIEPSITKTAFRPEKKVKLTLKMGNVKSAVVANSQIIKEYNSDLERRKKSIKTKVKELNEECDKFTEKTSLVQGRAYWQSQALTDILKISNLHDEKDWDRVLKEIGRLMDRTHSADSLERETESLRHQIRELTGQCERQSWIVARAEEMAKIWDQRQMDICALKEERRRIDREREGDREEIARLRGQLGQVESLERQVKCLSDENAGLVRRREEDERFSERVEELLKQRNKR